MPCSVINWQSSRDKKRKAGVCPARLARSSPSQHAVGDVTCPCSPRSDRPAPPVKLRRGCLPRRRSRSRARGLAHPAQELTGGSYGRLVRPVRCWPVGLLGARVAHLAPTSQSRPARLSAANRQAKLCTTDACVT
jgi:hypothetical protein